MGNNNNNNKISDISRAEMRHLFVETYQHTLQYNSKPAEDIFPKAYHTIIRSPVTGLFDAILDLEQSYAFAIQELHTKSDQQLILIQSRQAREMESANDMTDIFNKQLEEVEEFQTTWQTKITQMQHIQRQEYREFVIELYNEYRARIAALLDKESVNASIKQLDGKKIAATVIKRMEHEEEEEVINKGSSVLSSKGSSASSNHLLKPDSTPKPLRRQRTGSLVNTLAPNQQHALSPAELASLVRTVTVPEVSIEMVAVCDTNFQKMVKSIQEMGFAKEQAETALILSNNKTEGAISLLLENPAKVDHAISETKLQQQQQQQQQQFQQMRRPPASSKTPYRRSHSVSQVQRPTFISNIKSPSPPPARPRSNTTNIESGIRSPPAFLSTIMSSGNNTRSHSASPLPVQNKGWNPFSFIQQQQPSTPKMEAPSPSPPITSSPKPKRFGGWLGKAIENLGIDNSSSTSGYVLEEPTPLLVESFTVTLGTTQVKSSHNLRLLVTDQASEVFHPGYDPARESAHRAETALKLYTSNLNAAIVLVELSELDRPNGWQFYKSGKGSNKALFDRCQQTTEFHFDDIEQQLTTIEHDFNEAGLQEGCFFITKHSNLPTTQVVFHLIIDSIFTNELTTRHPLVLGLRHVLKLCSQYDISSLSIPLLLLPDRVLQQPDPTTDDPQPSLLLQKRGQVVLKCVKGYLIENSRNGRRVQNEGLDRAESMAGGGLRNLEFVLPSQAELYSARSDVELTFEHFRESLVNLFPTNY
ncbi:hypothetical protein K501DRAFT_209601 [Backusella circina FSU 941]|nr:hypothetical protein K501DRAFT_209601 [Backusella circina FSU 941]